MPIAQREVEQKFDIPPDLGVDVDALGVAVAAARVEVDVVEIDSTYLDTPEQDLLAARVTLRRRLGGADTGWQVKLPAAIGRTELHWPAAGDQPPPDLLESLAPLLSGHVPVPAIRLAVTRTRHRLIDDHDQLIAEVALDDVHAPGLGVPVRAPRWHEAEVELGPAATADTASALARPLREAGAVTSTSRSKLARAAVGIGNEQVGEPRASAGAVLMAYLGDQVDVLVAGLFDIARDEPDSVHQTRVATRRFRSTLRTFAECFDADQAADLGERLREYAEALGAVRDPEVLRTRLTETLAELPPELVHSDVAERVEAHLADAETKARQALLARHASPTHARLLGDVVRWRADPPLTVAAGRPARTLLATVGRMRRKLGKRVLRASNESDEVLHSARKAGKRARYAAEALAAGPSADQAAAVVARARKLQNLLGEFQDSVVAEQFLAELAHEVHRQGGDGFTLGVLVAGERERAQRARSRARKAARKA